jgi:single-strand DNA-binding protein
MPHLCNIKTNQQQMGVRKLKQKQLNITIMNTVKLIGNVGQEVNVLKFDTGKKASFSLATTDSYTDKNNQQVKNTAWHNVIAWGKIADQCEMLVAKGKLLSVEGKLNYRNYLNSLNQKVYVTEIVAFKVEEYTPVKNQTV